MKYIFSVLIFTCFVSALLAQCPPAGGGDVDGNITITGTCVVNADLFLKKKNLTITSTGSLTVNGDFNNDGSGIVSIDGGDFIVTGSFNNNGNGTVEVQNGGLLDVSVDYLNAGNGTTNFLDGTINIGGNYANNGNGNIDAGGVVTVGGDFTVSGNGFNTISGGLNIGGTATLGSKGVDINDGGVLQANAIVSEGTIDIEFGGTINVVSGSITGTINNDPGNLDQDCTNNCCGNLCNAEGNDLSTGGLSVLPVELLFFIAKQEKNYVAVEWATATELNNDFYTLERSFDGLTFEVVDRIAGAGTSQSRLEYHFKDYPSYFGSIYYRLTQTDFDGTSEQFRMIRIHYQSQDLPEPKIYPTVLKSGQQVTIENFWGTINSLDLSISDLGGKTDQPVRDLTIGGQIKFDTSGLNSGIYILSGNINGTHIKKRLIVKD